MYVKSECTNYSDLHNHCNDKQIDPNRPISKEWGPYSKAPILLHCGKQRNMRTHGTFLTRKVELKYIKNLVEPMNTQEYSLVELAGPLDFAKKLS